jgi:hypothetical protein
MQMIQNCEERRGGLHAIAKHTTINYRMCLSLL